jgi:hypothetical protein
VYLLRFLERARRKQQDALERRVAVEYRLACSGELLNRRAVVIDWRKSDIARILLRAPFELFVSSQPFDTYSQELCVRTIISRMTERDGTEGVSFTRDFLPDEDIIEDLCSVLSLLSRRLISLVGKTRERHFLDQPALGSYGSDLPVPILSISQAAVWRRRPLSILTNQKGQQLID